MPPLPVLSSARRYGYLRDVPDHRDLGIASLTKLARDQHPPVVDLEPFCGPVRDQGSEGSCTAHAGVGMREFLARKYQGQTPVLSPSFLYYQERLLDESLDQGDCGSYGRTVCRALNQFGVCTLGEEPYKPGHFSESPSKEQLANGLAWKGGSYHRVGNVSDMKSCLASGYVFAIGFTVYESFEAIGADGLWNPNVKKEQVFGGHEVLAIGYNDSVNGGSFKVRNSWGPGWAASGNFWFRYREAADPNILQDAWMIHLGRAWG